MKKFIKIRLLPLFLLIILLVVKIMPSISNAADSATDTVDLGTASAYAVLAYSTITNVGSTTISGIAGGYVDGNVGGNIGVYPNTSITGFPPGVVSDGTIQIASDDAKLAMEDLSDAFIDASSRTYTQDLTGQDLGGLTLTPGVYSFSSSAQLTGELTLDAQGDENAVFIFQIASTLTTASGSSVSLIGDARFCRVFWSVGSSATLGSNSDFRGHILASTSITANTGAFIQGQLLALNGAVTLDSNDIINGFCATIGTETTGSTETAGSTETTGSTETAGSTETGIGETTLSSESTETTRSTETETTSSEKTKNPSTGDSDKYLIPKIVLIATSVFVYYVVDKKKRNII